MPGHHRGAERIHLILLSGIAFALTTSRRHRCSGWPHRWLAEIGCSAGRPGVALCRIPLQIFTKRVLGLSGRTRNVKSPQG
jgi:hypothetical protein